MTGLKIVEMLAEEFPERSLKRDVRLCQLITQAINAEREACAKIAETHDSWEHGECNAACQFKIANAIRART